MKGKNIPTDGFLAYVEDADCPWCKAEGVLHCDICVDDETISSVCMCGSCGKKFGYGRYLDGRPIDEASDISWIEESIKSAVEE